MVDFLVIGPYLGCIYGNVYPLIQDRKIRLGIARGGMYFSGIHINTCWFQNMIEYCPSPLMLKKRYSDMDYRMIENFDALNISKTEFIPQDYYGVMAVPVSFIEFWNHHQFELVGLLADNKGDGIYIFNGTETYTDERHKKSKCGVIDGKRIFHKLLIKPKKKFS